MNSCAGMITNKGVWLVLLHQVQKVTTFMYSCVERWVVQRNNNVMRIFSSERCCSFSTLEELPKAEDKRTVTRTEQLESKYEKL